MMPARRKHSKQAQAIRRKIGKTEVSLLTVVFAYSYGGEFL